jgi:flavin reductase (DIM6/NTAB) family NADH-FMN oxidoreductase RutF
VAIAREAFLDIMTTFPTGVTVVTTVQPDGRPCGLTSNAVSSVSADPPTLLVCVSRTSRTLPALLERRGFVVNFMADGSEEVCSRFASRASAEEKFAGLEWAPGPDGLPHLHAHAVAHARCEIEAEVEAGTHVILLARVVGGEVHPARAPLAYVGRGYCTWPVAPSSAAEGR